ncbi:MAG: 23S rRNA pseudouridine(955/2504/2580) synthase RluC [Gammaproteobacteria bacterium]|nr:23S rRNA pseudouridine(955/2504/2580) synthase RluC [Gammaproteobacteria bacterium]
MPTEQVTSRVEFVTVAPDQGGQRIDNFLLRHLKGVPKTLIYRILRKGEVRVNKGRIKPDYRVQAGDEIRIPPIRRSLDEKRPPSNRSVDVLSDRILYEDERLIIVNKPAGMAVHGGSGVSHGIIETMRHWRQDLHYLELVHRLDRETSGCLVLAKKRSALRQLHELLREGQVEKRYLALVKGPWSHGRQRVELALQKNVLRSGERMVNVDEEGKVAVSTFIPLAVGKQASLMEIHIETGRTHQIRVHAAHLDHPIAGDDKYGDKEFNRQMQAAGLTRLFLHARSLAFTLMEPHKDIAVNAPLDKELTQLLDKLGLQTE